MDTIHHPRSVLLCFLAGLYAAGGFAAGGMTWDGHFDALDRAVRRRTTARALKIAEPDIPMISPEALNMEIPYIYDPRDPGVQTKYTQSFLELEGSGDDARERGHSGVRRTRPAEMIWAPISLPK